MFSCIALGVILSPAVAGQTAEEIVSALGVKGGVVVHVGDDANLTAALRLNDRYVVQGLVTSRAKLREARAKIAAAGEYGPVSIAVFDGENLPYADNMVNLIVISNQSSVTSEEVERVLAPSGVVLTSSPLMTDHRSLITHSPVPGGWHAYTKSIPSDIDTWSHHLHGADNNAVAMDKQVDTPQSLKWVCKPLWARSHEFLSSISVMVSDGGRIFYVVDEGLTAIHTKEHSFEKWMLTARDAFNGKLLWKKPLSDWGQKPWKKTALRATPSDAPKRLVAVGDVLYCTLGYTAPVSAVDAASGEVLKTYAGTEDAKELRVLAGVLLARTNQGLIAIDTDSGSKLWETKGKIQANVTAAADGKAFYVDGKRLLCRDLKGGDDLWAKSDLGAIKQLLVYGGYLLVAGGKLNALNPENGKMVWAAKASLGKNVLFAANGLVWAGSTAYSLETGSQVRRISGEDVISVGHHPRCYPQKATQRFLITPHRGTEFISITGGENTQNDWLRGPCTFGVLPCNGLLYVGPNPCFCYPGVKVTGLNALAGKTDVPAFSGERLEKGKAYGKAGGMSNAGDWPTFRRDSRRTGGAQAKAPTDLKTVWRTKLTGKLTQPVISNGKVYIAEQDHHTLHAIDETSGNRSWSYTAGGRIDSAPTVHKGLVLFGSADGRVHCLRATDGELAWCFLAAPSPRQIMAFDQLESPWRVHGSVLVVKGKAYFTAGRSTNLDGGIRVYGLNPKTGEVLHQATLHSWSRTREDAVGKPVIPGYAMEGAFSDVLVSEGGYIYLGQYKLDLALNRQDVPYIMREKQEASPVIPIEDLKGKDYIIEEDQIDRIEKVQHDWQWRVHPTLMKEYEEKYGGATMGERSTGRRVFSTGGFLDDSFFNRTFWMYSETWPGFYAGNRGAKSGHLLVVDDSKTYAMSAFPGRNVQSPQFFPGEQGYLIKADANDSEPVLPEYTRGIPKGIGFTRTKDPVWHKWVPILVRAMTVTENALFVAGAPDELVDGDPMASFEGRNGAVLRVMSKKDGTKISELKLDAPPVFDGMSAANGRLYMALTNGELVCLGEN